MVLCGKVDVHAEEVVAWILLGCFCKGGAAHMEYIEIRKHATYRLFVQETAGGGNKGRWAIRREVLSVIADYACRASDCWRSCPVGYSAIACSNGCMVNRKATVSIAVSDVP